jgi:hypothetical protein
VTSTDTTMTTTTPELAAMPTEAQMEEALRIITHDLAGATVKICGPVRRIAKFEGKEAPTLEEIGRLYVFVENATHDLEEVQDHIANVRRDLFELDYVRNMENVDPDAEE